MGMEQNKFMAIVDDLLEPQVKEAILKNRRQQRKPDTYTPPEDSIKLAPRGLSQPCGDCGLLVRNRVVQFAVYDLARNPYWKKKCMECGQKSVVSHPIKNV
jgi:hypothetical protein